MTEEEKLFALTLAALANPALAWGTKDETAERVVELAQAVMETLWVLKP
jgi:urease gamma subunit